MLTIRIELEGGTEAERLKFVVELAAAMGVVFEPVADFELHERGAETPLPTKRKPRLV